MSMPTESVEAPNRYVGVIENLDERIYHAQPELSSTGARTLINDSPARFKYNLTHRTGSAAFDVGHAVHAKVLGVGGETVEYPPEHLTPSGRPSTKAATAAWVDEQRAAGLVPLAPDQVREVEVMAEAVLAHPFARRIFESDGKPEVSVFTEDPATGVKVRARFDWLGSGGAWDLKTTAGSASARGFGASAAKYDYPFQQVWYEDAYAWATGVPVDMGFVVVEKAAPHFVAVHRFDDVARLIASDKAKRARELYAECTATDSWPAYGDDVLATAIPAWWYSQNEEELPDSWT